VEVCTAKTRIILDIGLPLTNSDLPLKEILPNIPALFGNGDDKETALLISHAHQDHYGLLSFVDKKVPVYLGKAAHKLIELTAIFAGKKTVIENPRYFENLTPFTFGDIEITPYLMDHAAFDAYAFVLRGGEKTLIYTGDFRSHGRKPKHFYKFLALAPKKPDWLLMEGTSLSRLSDHLPRKWSDKRQLFETEGNLENQLTKIFRRTKGITLAYVSGQNIDRLVTMFRSCRRSGKIFVIDFYIANVLYEMAQSGSKLPHPSPAFPDIRVFFPSLLRAKMEKINKDLIERFLEFEITMDEINKDQKRFVMTVRSSMKQEIYKLNDLSGGNLIYSMWEGYKEDESTKRFLSMITDRGAIITTVHTSGHADYYTMKKLLTAVQPKNVIPIHTTEGANYKNYFPQVNVKQAADGETIGNI
jgi:ribonuclease J